MLFIATGALAVSASRARAQDQAAPPPDSLLLPSYESSYDRDRTRELWTQTLGYGISTKRAAFNVTAGVSTQNFLKSQSKSTTGSIDGSLNYKLVGNWLLVLHGFFDMNTSTDGPNDLATRGNRINIKTQYQFTPLPAMNTLLWLSSEFEQRQDRTRNDRLNPADPFDSTTVDSSLAQRDSSFTTSRKDAVNAEIAWPARSWLQLSGKALAYRSHPTITSFQRTFVNPLDGTSGGVATEERQRTTNPSGSTLFNASAAVSRRAAKIVFSGANSKLRQSYFDKQRSRQETSLLDNKVAGITFDSPMPHGWFLHSEGNLSKNLNEYTLNRNRTILSNGRHFLSMLQYMKPAINGNVNFSVDRTRTELQPSSNGVELNRALGGRVTWRTGRKLALDANGSATLFSNDYENDRIDRDIQRTFFSVGGGYLLTPACSTTVHFSRGKGHVVSLDPSLSGSNAVTTTYQMNATMVYLPTRNFALRQSYLLSAEYRILDYVESQNSLVRARRIDTDAADTLFSFAIFRLTHNFVFQDQGTYARFGTDVNRKYAVATRSYDQTVTATVGAKIAPGVLFLATQSLLNRRAEALAARSQTLQNTWKLNLSFQVFRTLSDGIQIDGAVRRLSEYVEGRVTSKDTTRDDWVAGVSVHKDF